LLVHSTKHLDKDGRSLSGFKWRMTDREAIRRLLSNKNIARGYVGGTDTGNYEDFDPNNFENNIVLDTSYSSSAQGIDYPAQGQAKYFVANGGADTPRPIQLACNASGYWKVTSWSSLTSGVKPAKAVEMDF